MLNSKHVKYLVAADGEQDVLLGDLESCGEHGFEVRLVSVLPKAGNFPGAGHLHPEHHIGPGKAREGELGNLENGRHTVIVLTDEGEEKHVWFESIYLNSHNPFSTH